VDKELGTYQRLLDGYGFALLALVQTSTFLTDPIVA